MSGQTPVLGLALHPSPQRASTDRALLQLNQSFPQNNCACFIATTQLIPGCPNYRLLYDLDARTSANDKLHPPEVSKNAARRVK